MYEDISSTLVQVRYVMQEVGVRTCCSEGGSIWWSNRLKLDCN